MPSDQRPRHSAALIRCLLLLSVLHCVNTHAPHLSVTPKNTITKEAALSEDLYRQQIALQSGAVDNQQPFANKNVLERKRVIVDTKYPEECLNAPNVFSWEDYMVLGAMLLISCGIGLFYGCFGPKQTSSNDFLLGGSDMGTIPLALSLTTSFITAIELLGNPSEMYTSGTQYWLIVLSFVIVLPIANFIFLPVFCKLRLTSCYEYLGLRFDKRVRIIASVLYVLQMVLYTSVAVYAPALALSHVTGLNTYVAVTLVYMVCIFYASQGGMKAVIVADSFQTVVLAASLILVLALGITGLSLERAEEGTWLGVWKSAARTGRMEFLNVDPNPTTRHTVWSVVIGGSFYWASMFCTNQASVQKYLSVSTMASAKRALWGSCLGLFLVFSINFYTGLVLHAHYEGCDPLQTGEVMASDQLLPLYVMQVLGHLRGVPGFFVAGIFAASLGTVASALNSLSAVTCEDLLDAGLNIQFPVAKGAMWAKWLSLGFGVLSFALVFVVERLGGVLQVALSFNGMAGGVTLGMFVLGMCFPRANARGALAGTIVAMALVFWIGIGAQIWGFPPEPLDSNMDHCPCANQTTPNIPLMSDEGLTADAPIFVLYRISYLWYGALGCMITIITGIFVSEVDNYFGEGVVNGVHLDLLCPPVAKMMGVATSVENKDKSPVKVEMNGETNLGLSLDEGKR